MTFSNVGSLFSNVENQKLLFVSEDFSVQTLSFVGGSVSVVR